MESLPRDYRMRTVSGTSGGCTEKRGWLQVAHLGVEQAKAAVRRWELEVELLRGLPSHLPARNRAPGRLMEGQPHQMASGDPGGRQAGTDQGLAWALAETGRYARAVVAIGGNSPMTRKDGTPLSVSLYDTIASVWSALRIRIVLDFKCRPWRWRAVLLRRQSMQRRP